MVRIDRFLSICKIYKKRSLAKKALDDGLVEVNYKKAKPSTIIKNGDDIRLYLGLNIIVIKAIIEKHENKYYVSYQLVFSQNQSVPLC